MRSILILGLLLSHAACGGKKDPASKTQPLATIKTPASIDAGPPLDAAHRSAKHSVSDAGTAQIPVDAALLAKPTTTSPSSKRHSVSELAGNWSGSAVVPQYGVAIASLRLNKKGKGTFRVNISGFTKTGPIQIVSWNGKSIRARAESIERRIPAKLMGNKLRLTLPIVGNVTVYR